MRVPRKKIAGLVAFITAREGVSVSDLDVAVVDRRRIAALNRRYLGRTGPTDVLSFDLAEGSGKPISAQIVVCGPVAADRARRRGLSVHRELLLYVAHGLLHLIGYEDNSRRAAAELSAREEDLLRAFLHEK